MFVELDERELMKHDGGGMLLSGIYAMQLKNLQAKISDEFVRGIDDEYNRNISNHEQHYVYAG